MIKTLEGHKVYMLIGNGSKNQFRDTELVCNVLDLDLHRVPQDSVFLYFGDVPNAEKPDVGFLFSYIASVRPDLKFQMIQIDAVKKYGKPDFVTDVYWHDEWVAGPNKWGGVDEWGTPQSNTRKWVDVHNALLELGHPGIQRVFVYGGGVLTFAEQKFARDLKIPVDYKPVERKYKGDKVTLITDEDTRTDRIGVTHGLPFVGYCFGE